MTITETLSHFLHVFLRRSLTISGMPAGRVRERVRSSSF
jgi:hypothetical protein